MQRDLGLPDKTQWEGMALESKIERIRAADWNADQERVPNNSLHREHLAARTVEVVRDSFLAKLPLPSGYVSAMGEVFSAVGTASADEDRQ